MYIIFGNKVVRFLFWILALICLSTVSKASVCNPRNYGFGSIVCVCTAEHCDTVTLPKPSVNGEYTVYTSSKSGYRFKTTKRKFNEDSDISPDVTAEIMPEKAYQKILGWGGAFTDSAGINMNSLNDKAREQLLKSYFSDEGIEYSLCRVPIAGTDFSTHPYTYDDEPGDTNLSKFNLTVEDYELKIPLIQKAVSLSNNKLNLFASSWTAPPWMKTSNKYAGHGYLLKHFYQTWADYHIKFLEAYKKEGIKFWGLTTGNEPVIGFWYMTRINCMAWSPFSQERWISENLGPTIRNSEFSDTKIIALDDQRIFLPWWIEIMFKNPLTRKYVDGIGVHWYYDNFFPSLLNWTHEKFPDKFVLGTEACIGDPRIKHKVGLGSWKRGEMYAVDIFEDLTNWVTGWVDWNLALNTEGGPTYVKNEVDSPIIVNATAQEFYKQPMFYVMGHFSKFVPPSSVRMHVEYKIRKYDLPILAFQRPDNGTAIVVFNYYDRDISLSIIIPEKGTINLNILKRSINSIIYW